ncbi:hypothetical protein OSTOST_11762 [Ostertagia ostertagi]
MEMIGEKYPGVVVIDRKPSQTIRVLDQVLQLAGLLCAIIGCGRLVSLIGHCFSMVNSNHTLRNLRRSYYKQWARSTRTEWKECVVLSCRLVVQGLVIYSRSTSYQHTNLRWSVAINFPLFFISNPDLNGFSEGPPIYLLDTDVGQSEFTPAGCMSLWKISDPILDVPCTHQVQIYPCCYFFGNITPADDADRYKEIFDRLLNEFQTTSEPGSLLIINTSLGWIDGLGCQLLSHIFDVSRPMLALSLSHDRGSFTVSFCMLVIVA